MSLGASQDNVFLTWNNINFIVPKLKRESGPDANIKLVDIDDANIALLKNQYSANNDISTGNTNPSLVTADLKTKKLLKANNKQILHGITGYAKPG